ncbi:hypothetical protein [Hydrogenispora ethanolica]|uniref:hypothetical protein n=1 Tax=Hydrogenispora ethanolica TaxID=1082276 RepID=UPI00104286EB|nr:hypothetical protein [Hydrogenispora ethanolica]
MSSSRRKIQAGDAPFASAVRNYWRIAAMLEEDYESFSRIISLWDWKSCEPKDGTAENLR